MADVLAEAVVELIPDITKFAKNFGKDLSKLNDDTDKAMAGIDKKMSSIGGGASKAFKDVEKSSQDANDKIITHWRRTATGIEAVYERVGDTSNKTNKQMVLHWKKTADGVKLMYSDIETLAKRSNKNVVAEFKKSADGAKKSGNDIGKMFDGANSSLLNLVKRLGSVGPILMKITSVGTSLVSVLPVLVSIGNLIATAAGSAAILPGILATIAVSAGVVKLAFHGISDAITAKDATELAEAMKDLAPQAQKFVLSIRALKDEFLEVRKSVQAAFFAGFSERIDSLATKLIPILNTGLTGTAKQFNIIAKSIFDMLEQSGGLTAIRSILDSTSEVVRNLGRAFAPILEALLAIIDVGADVFSEITEGAGAAAERFRDFIKEAKESGRLREFITDGLAALKQLWQILVDIVAIVGNVFRPLIDSAGELKTPLGEVLGIFREFTASEQFVTFMRTLGDIFTMLANAIGTVFGAALRAVLPPLQLLLFYLSDHLAIVIPQILPALLQFIDFLGDLLSSLTPLIEPMLKLSQTLLPAMTALLVRIMDAIDLGKLFIFAEVIAIHLVSAFERIAPLLMIVIDFMARLFEAISPILPILLEIAMVVLPIVIMGLSLLVFAILGLIALALMPLIAIFNELKFVVQVVWAFITGDTEKATALIEGRISSLRSIISIARSIFTQMHDAIIEKLVELINWVKGLPGKIIAALGDLGMSLFRAGATLVQGFINGVKSMLPDVGRAANTIVAAVKSFFPFSPAKQGPLSGRGYVTYSGEALIRDFAKSLGNDALINRAMDQLMASTSARLTTGMGALAGLNASAVGRSVATGSTMTSMLAARTATPPAPPPGDNNTEVHVFIGDQEITSMVTTVISEHDRRTKRAVITGARRTP